MKKKKYLIYVDILGFKSRAKEIADKTGFEEDVIRETFLSRPLRKKIEEIKKKEIEISKGISEIEGSDNYVLAIDDIETAFETVGNLMTIKIPHKDYKYIPCEIGLDTREIDEDIDVEPINRKEVINFLKNDIITPYKKYYKGEHEGGSIKETFVLFTREFFEDLGLLDKNYCEEIFYKKKTFFVADIEKVQQRCKVFRFLEKIGYPGSGLYGRIDEVYVPPVEYEDIKKTLKEERIVFITGTQEYGKTYTAVRLLWKYYKQEYEPIWVRGGEDEERIEARKRLEDIRTMLKPNHIIYFEDPFGKTRYEKRENLEKEIGVIIDSIKHMKDFYVIITSREEVFKEFEKENLSATDIEEFEKSLNLRKPSYGDKKRKEILEKWAENENCKWFKDENLKKSILKRIEDVENLPTPLKMRAFAIATVDEDRVDRLEEKMKEKSEETARAFSKEIKNMTDDKVLFLSFLFISGHFEVDFIRRMYDELVKELNLTDPLDFDRVLNWFKDDKASISERIIGFPPSDRFEPSKYVKFSHFSYYEALKYLLVEDGCITRINKEIFSGLLRKLSEKKDADLEVAFTIANNFDNLPENIRDLVFELSEKDRAASGIGLAMRLNSHRFPDDVRNKLLLNISEKNETVGDVAWAIIGNFDNLPDDIKKLLFEISKRDEAAADVAWAIIGNFDRLSEDVKDLLFTLSERSGSAKGVAEAIELNFDNLPEDVRNKLLLKLAEKDEAARDVAGVVAHNFDNCPQNVKNLLFELSERNGVASFVALAIAHNFDNLPEDVRNKLLLKLAEKDEAARDVALTITENFDRLSEDIKDLLFKFSEKDRTAGNVAWAVACHFNNLPENVRNLLFKLSEREESAQGVASAVERNFNKLPEDVRNKLLLELSEKDEAAGYVALTITENFNSLPDNIKGLLFELAEKDEAAWGVIRGIVGNFNNLPEDVKNLVFKLFESNKAIGHITYSIAHNFGKLPHEVRDLLLKLAEKDEAAGDVARAIYPYFESFPPNVRNELLLKLSKKEEAAEFVTLTIAKNYDKIPEDVRNSLIELSEGNKTMGYVAQAIAENFNYLPDSIRDLFLELSERDEAICGVARGIAENFNYLPDSIKSLLFKLSRKDEAATYVALAIAENFEDLPQNVKNLLDELQKPLKKVIRYFSMNSDLQYKEHALHLISNTWRKINLNFLFEILNGLSKCENEKIRAKAKEMLKIIFNNSKDMKNFENE